MGVTVEAFVSQGTVLGPLPTTWIIMDIGSLIGHMTADNFGHTSQVKIDVAQSVGNPSHLLEWILYVNCARLDDEQNLEVLETEIGLFYRITKDVQAGEHLLLWYSEDLQNRLGLSKLKASAQGLSAPYRCTSCGETFQYPNPYVCHLRFKCASKTDSEASLSLGSSVNNNNNEDRQAHTPRPGSKRGSAGGDESAPAKRPCIEQPQPAPYGPLVPDLALATAAAQLATYQQLVHLALASMQLPPPTLMPPLLVPFQPNPGAEPVRTERTTPPSSRRLEREREMQARNAPGSSPTQPEVTPGSGRATLPSAPPRGGPSPAGNSLPSFKAHNPVVDEVLKGLAQPQAAPESPNLLAFSMLQNWCAKCNQVFRMTNDLVHHMRVYHRNAKDEKITLPDRAAALRGHSDPANSAFEPPAPAKREEKLRCNICGERFRERHHLSRHLTSHE